MDVRNTVGEPRLFINRQAILHNARIIRQVVGNHVSLCAVIKADAYGHGASIVTETLCDYPLDDMGSPPVNALAVATIDEGAALRELEIPLLILRPVENAYLGRSVAQIEHAIRAGWVLTICSAAAADDVARIAMQCQAMAFVQVMLDTGMSRSGVCLQQFADLMSRIERHVSLKLFGFCTHFACSEDASDPFTRQQFESFRAATEPYIERSKARLVRHAANSGAVFNWPGTHLDMVRPGLAFYGVHPSCRWNEDATALNLRPALKWVANILMLRDVRQGTGVGYGQTWHAERNSRLALVPVGYADGYMRELSNKAVMMVHGQPAPVVGLVSMDLTVIDVTGIPDVTPGDEVVILDDNPSSPASIYELARRARTIPYEIFCRIGSRIHRVAAEAPVEEAAVGLELDRRESRVAGVHDATTCTR
jgi:alanine racemase